MARLPRDAVVLGMGSHGLRFLNDEWNDSISNGNLFTLRWNLSLDKSDSELGLFKVMYPKDGVVVYELVSNLTGSMDTASCLWTPAGLNEELYALWLTAGQHAYPNWTLSPPWKPKEDAGHNETPWAAPFIIPVVCILVLYAICLTTCLVYRRRKRAKRGKEGEGSHQDANRNNSVDSAMTVQTLAELDSGANKPGVWILTTLPTDTEITVEGVAEKDVADGQVAERDVRFTHDECTIGVGL